MRSIKNLFLISMFFLVSSAQARFMPLSDSDLSNQSLYARGAITTGARTTVGGNLQSDAAVKLGAHAILGDDIDAGTSISRGDGTQTYGDLHPWSEKTIPETPLVKIRKL